MFKRILSIIEQDTVNSLRNNIIVYMLIVPLILAIGIRLLLPSVGSAKPTFAVDANVSPSVVQELKTYGRVEMYPSKNDVVKRVNLNDDVPGIVKENGKIVVLLEGNEGADTENIVDVVMSAILSKNQSTKINCLPIKSEKFPLEGYAIILLIFMAVLIGASWMGFNIVEEKENGVIKALAISPLTIFQYVIARALLVFFIGVILAFLMELIMGVSPMNYVKLTIGILFSTVVGITFGLTVGIFADNQLSAIAVMKVLGFVYLALPLVSIFVPDKLQFLFYLFPNYWMFQMFRSLYLPTYLFGFWFSGFITLISGTLLLIIFMPFTNRKLSLKNF